MKAVVTGAAGFIGSHLVEALSADPTITEVVAIDAFTNYYSPDNKRQNTQDFDTGKVRLIQGDLLTLDLEEHLSGANRIFHQAGQPGVRKSWGAEFITYTRQNVDATQRLLEHALQVRDLKAFVYASSSSVYGDAERYPTQETDLPAPRSPYGVTKLAAEHLCSLYAAQFGLPTISLRYFTVYGPRQRPDMAFTKFLLAAKEGRPLDVYGDGTQIREFTYVSDIVKANLLAASADAPPGTVVNLSGGSTITVNEVLAIIEQLHGRPLPISYQARVAGDVYRTGGATDRALELFNWRPQVAIQAGLREQYEWVNSTNFSGSASS